MTNERGIQRDVEGSVRGCVRERERETVYVCVCSLIQLREPLFQRAQRAWVLTPWASLITSKHADCNYPQYTCTPLTKEVQTTFFYGNTFNPP